MRSSRRESTGGASVQPWSCWMRSTRLPSVDRRGGARQVGGISAAGRRAGRVALVEPVESRLDPSPRAGCPPRPAKSSRCRRPSVLDELLALEPHETRARNGHAVHGAAPEARSALQRDRGRRQLRGRGFRPGRGRRRRAVARGKASDTRLARSAPFIGRYRRSSSRRSARRSRTTPTTARARQEAGSGRPARRR